MANANQTKGNTGNRYPESMKKKVVEFIESKGRGGTTQAQKKFGVSYIAVRSWMNKYGSGAKNSPKDASPAKNGIAKFPKREFNALVKKFKIDAMELLSR